MSAVVHSSGNTLAIPTRNAFEQYAEEAKRNRIVGDLLKFKKTEWVVGQKEDEVAMGTRYIADMDGLLVGWTRWSGGKPSDTKMGRVLESYQAPRRNELGDDDSAEWDLDDNGKPKDPWQFGNTLILKAEVGDDLFTFNAGSKGSIGMIGDLCGAYGRAMRQRPSDFPIIAIGRGFYMHKTYGKTYTPEMKIVGWAPKASVIAAIDGEAAENAANEEAEAEVEAFEAAPKAGKPPKAEKTTSTGAVRF